MFPSPINMALACWKGFVYILKEMFARLEEVTFDIATTFASFVIFLCSLYTLYLQKFDYINCPDSGEPSGAHYGRFCFFDGLKPNCINKDVNHCYGDAFYHWTPYILLIQAGWLYAPKFVLNRLNGNKWEKALTAFHETQIRKLDLYQAYREFVARIFGSNYLAHLTVVCEVFVGLTYALQLTFMEVTFNIMIHEDVYNSNNNFDVVFPKTMQCTHPEVGENGMTVYKVDKCEIPLNYANEYIYSYQWPFFKLMYGITAFIFFYRLVSAYFYKSNAFNRFEFGRVCCGKVCPDELVVVADSSFMTWLCLRRLAGHLKADNFNLLLQVLAKEKAAMAIDEELMEANLALKQVEIVHMVE